MDGLADEQSLNRWWQEHSELDWLVDGVIDALAEGRIARIEVALESLETTMDAHFTVEEKIYFPLVEQLSATHHEALQNARTSHQRVRERLNDVRELAERGEIDGARRAFQVLMDQFRKHEQEETKMILELEALASEAAS